MEASNTTDYSTMTWPEGYDFEDISNALLKFPETYDIKEDYRFAKFETLVAKKTGTSEVLRLPEPFSQVTYFVNFIDLVNKKKTEMCRIVFESITKMIVKLKEFATNMSTREPKLKSLIEEESSPTRSQLLTDPTALESMIAGIYNTSKENIPVYTARFNKLKYGLECIIWGKDIDMDVFEEDGSENTDMKLKFAFLKKLSASLNPREKTYLVVMLRELVRCIAAIFMIRRTNLTFDRKKVYKFSYYFGAMKIARLKELATFDENPFLLPDGTELTEATHKDAYAAMKVAKSYDQEIDSIFGCFNIDLTKL